MSEHQTIELFLTQPQFLKYRKGKTFQLTNSQLQSDSGKNKVDLHLAKSEYNKLLRAIKNGKGFRFTDKIVKGGSLWGSIKAGVGKVREGISRVGDFINRNKDKVAKVGQFIKDNVDPNFVKSVVDAGVDLVPKKYLNDKYKKLAKSAADKTVDYGYADNSGKSLTENAFSLADKLKPELTEVRYDAEDLALQKADKLVKKLKDKYIGDGIRAEAPKNKRPMKGSQEARDKMAMLRAMRKTKGSGLVGDILLPMAGGVAGTLIGGFPGAAIGQSLGSVVGRVIDGNGLKNTTHLKHGQLIDGVPRPVVSRQSTESVKKHGYYKKQRGKNGLHINGGAMLQLGGSAITLGGSFKSLGEK
jgi:hypothetical protein